MKVLKWLDKHFEEIFTFTFLVGMTLVMFLQVVMRYVFNNSLNWPEEFCRFSFIWMCFMGMSWCIRNGEMLRIEIIESFAPKLKRPLEYLANIASVAFCVYMIKPGITTYQNAVMGGQISSALHIPMQFIYISFLIGVCASVFRGVQKIVLMAMHKDGKTY